MKSYRCWACGMFYDPATLVIEPGHLYPVCADRERCHSAALRLFAATVWVLEP